MVMRPKRKGLVAGTLVLVATLIGVRQLDAPIILYPASASLPKGFYLRTFGAVEIGKIAAFPMPEVARRYEAQHGDQVPESFLFMKPIAAGPGDQVCNGPAGLFLNGRHLATTASHDALGNPLPVWSDCQQLKEDEFFMLSDYAPNSFDSRYFGPIKTDEIVGVYWAAF